MADTDREILPDEIDELEQMLADHPRLAAQLEGYAIVDNLNADVAEDFRNASMAVSALPALIAAARSERRLVEALDGMVGLAELLQASTDFRGLPEAIENSHRLINARAALAATPESKRCAATNWGTDLSGR